MVCLIPICLSVCLSVCLFVCLLFGCLFIVCVMLFFFFIGNFGKFIRNKELLLNGGSSRMSTTVPGESRLTTRVSHTIYTLYVFSQNPPYLQQSMFQEVTSSPLSSPSPLNSCPLFVNVMKDG